MHPSTIVLPLTAHRLACALIFSPPDIPVHYWVVVRAEDLGSPKMTNFYNVTIRLIDINDNPPELINIAATCVPGAPSDASVKEVC